VFRILNTDTLCQRLALPQSALPVLASIAGNDYSRNIPRIGIATCIKHLKQVVSRWQQDSSPTSQWIFKEFVKYARRKEVDKVYLDGFNIAYRVFGGQNEGGLSQQQLPPYDDRRHELVNRIVEARQVLRQNRTEHAAER
jgi:hypothetical protein